MNLQKEIIFGSDDANEARLISKAEKAGKLRKLASRLYTTNMLDAPENIVRRNLFDILSWRLPGAILSHRSGATLRPTEKGNLYLSYTFTKRIDNIPGIILNVMEGPKVSSKDIRLGAAEIFASSESRWMLEIMQPARRGKDGESKSLPQSYVEKRLEGMINAGGEERINAFRDSVRETASELGMMEEFEKLNAIISALLSTHDAEVLQSSSGKSRAAGIPIDANRVELFEILFDYLSGIYFPCSPEANITENSFRLFSFFESYFSNYIEGTEFSIEEARQIVETGITLPKRTADSHDILGTFRLASNRQEMMRTPPTEDELLAILRHRHEVLLAGRPDCSPGMFKSIPNRAGMTEFVNPSLVEGTLRQGFRYYRALNEPLARAIFMMFMCSEVHPFTDGNGRVSRLMMNAELVSAKQTRIIVPTAYREDYILSLRKLSRQGKPDTFVEVMQRLQKFSQNFFGENFDALHNFLIECNAYEKPEEARLKFIDRIGTASGL
ncbi:MAG: Fic family protein [Bacteroidales bacterium]|nr:Fic family protein [Bacteroidales bacterium]